MPTTPCLTLEVDRTDLAQVRIATQPLPSLDRGEVLLTVDSVALSANTLTYAALGDAAAYWDAFPAPRPWGRVPAWGHGTVVAAGPDAAITVGTRLYGLLPVGSHALLRPGAARHGWVVDTAPHRASTGEVYRRYRLLDTADTADTAEAVERRAVLAPVVVLSHLLDHLLAEEGLAGADQIVVTSASSKTALGLAHLLGRRGVPAVGLTGAGREDAVRAIGAYREVIAYEQVATGLPRHPSVVVDVAGDAAVRAAVESALGTDVVRLLPVGLARTHLEPVERVPSTLFSAPQRLVDLARRDGPAVLQQRVDAAVTAVEGWAAGWLHLVHVDGPQAAITAYHRVRAGAVAPAEGVVVHLGAGDTAEVGGPPTRPADLPATPEAMLEVMRARAIAGSPFSALLGIELLHCWDGQAELVVPVEDRLTQHHGRLHGGVVATALDNAGCWAAASVMGDLVTSTLTVHYLAPAVGERLRVRATVATTRGRTGVVHVEATAEVGELRSVVATGVVTVRTTGADTSG